jgi:uncharacterized protein (DUF433 family)
LKAEENLLNRIVINPKVMTGKPIIKGTRIPVEQVLRLLAKGLTFEEILKDYPNMIKEDIMAALLYAAKVIGREEVYPLT